MTAMIIANLVGGLGNQMFQYACGRACALDAGATLAVSTGMFRGYALHQGPELMRVFALDLAEASTAALHQALGWQSPVPLRRLLGRPVLRGLAKRSFVAEPHFQFWPGLRVRASGTCYLQGYWQSERYFACHAQAIRDDFGFRHAALGLNAELAQRIGRCEAVSLHVRRGDYVSNPRAQALHGCCPPQYYEAALRHVLERVPQATVFAFSDDPQWVAQTLQPQHPGLVIVDHNHGPESYNDMRLMALCRHHIIANSSFSWWGAWLDARPDKIVVAPAQWFATDRDTTDLVPAAWTRL